ncbi:DUF4331 family protein [Actinoplanes sp. Pm04-4]|uniref:DUF4331 family protein n=1 Tax=Paractinoplanes pyxinae TaxID=2997416 RepID=A0ABT4AZM4_9ACTN|nr:DUF4331 family protein [Actinoplanes pyxinae]MCY1139676.1 DUF4331 family protein [Actinoplanes pyxinae]
MSHHLDSPLARRDPRLNITDQYVFDDAGATVLILNAGTSLAGPDQPAGFHDEARYEFRVWLDGAHEDALAFRVAFEPGPEGAQNYTVHRVEGAADDATPGAAAGLDDATPGAAAGLDDATPGTAVVLDDAAPGVEVARGRTGETVRGADGLTAWAGRVRDPFYLDLGQLAAIDLLVQHGEPATITGFVPGEAVNTFAGSTVNSIVLRIPHSDPQLFRDRIIRVWSTTRLATDAGGWRPIGRAGLPMIWPIFRDADSDAASAANEAHPADDSAAYGKGMRELVAATVRRLGTTERPEAYAEAVVQRLLPDALPYQVGTPAVFGFTDFNGRALVDNAPEVVFSLVTNSAVGTGLPPAATADTRQEAFPYVVPA